MAEPVALVTGGAGYIGSHACKALKTAGYLPVAFDNLSTGHRDAVKWGPLVVGDVRNSAAVCRALQDHGAALVLHFAASAYVGESVQDPAKYYDNNVGGMISLLAGCRGAGVQNVVFSSSCATYGVPSEIPIRETSPQNPVNPYGYTKLVCEKILDAYAPAYGMRHVSLRYFNAAGADPDGEIGERHDPETHLIPSALLAASGRRPALELYGNDYDTPDGTCIRDYIHVSDLARAHVLAAGYLLGGGAAAALNLGSGQPLSVRQILRAIEEITGRPLPVIDRPRRAGDPPILCADVTRVQEVLGFQPELSDIRQIISDAVPWFGLSPG